jgi:iron complex outermembrane receptor protein
MTVKIKFCLLCLLSYILSSHYLNAQQQYELKGYVYDHETNEPVPNANIIIKGTKSGTSSDAEGSFVLLAGPGKQIIRFTSVGYAEKELQIEVPADNYRILRIGMTPQKIGIESVDVFGRMYPAGRDTSINRLPVSIMPAITKIEAADIEKQGAVTLVDAVKYVPGGWTETRGRKTKQFFSVRGQKYPYPNYSIDGIWQKEFEETGYFFSALDIESIEIVRSSSALVKGLSGLTGVVDVKTKKPEREDVSLIAKYGELNNYTAKLQYGNKIEDLSFNAAATLFGTDGPPDRNGRERIANFHGNINWKINNRLNLFAGATYIHGSREFVNIIEPGAPNIANREEKYDPLSTVVTYMKAEYKGNKGSRTELQANFTHRDADHSNYNIAQESTTITGEKDWEYGFNVLHSQPLSQSNTLRFGGLYNHWEAPGGKRYYVGRSCNVHTWSGVIADEHKTGRFLFDAGFRLIGGYIVEWGGFGIEGSASGFQNVEPIENEAAPVEWQSAFGVTYLLSGSLSAHYNFSGGTIAPRKGSLTGEGVTPETEGRFQHDLGLRYKCPRNNEFSISAFHTTRTNSIDYSGSTVITDNDMVLELYENLDRQSYGIELSTKINVPSLHSSLFANGMVMKGKKESGSDMAGDNQLPKVILNSGLYYDYSGIDANLFVHYTGPYTNNRFVNPAWVAQNGDFPLGDFVSLDATAGYTFKGKFSKRIFAEVKNILDKKYYTVAGYPDVGRLFQFGIRIN